MLPYIPEAIVAYQTNLTGSELVDRITIEEDLAFLFHPLTRNTTRAFSTRSKATIPIKQIGLLSPENLTIFERSLWMVCFFFPKV
jgi:hypothetical protein